MTQGTPCFLIEGGNFYGRGAEAMMFVVRDCLRQTFGNPPICVPISRVSQYDQFLEAGLTPVLAKRLSLPLRAARRLFREVGIVSRKRLDPRSLGRKPVGNPFRLCDTVIDISGFASSDQWGVKKAQNRLFANRLARLTGCDIIFMPQAWGPFENPAVARRTERLLHLAQLIFARDRFSYEALTRLPNAPRERIHLAPDIAFRFRPSSHEQGKRVLERVGLDPADRPIVGFTPNMRVYERTEGDGPANSYVAMLSSVIDRFLSQTDCAVALITHEISDRRDDDRTLCRMLAEMTTAPERVAQIPAQTSAADLKATFGHMQFCVASRYHSLVAAMSMRLPAAVVGWSHKYDELMRSAGTDSWMIDPVRHPDDAGLARILDAWEHRDEIREAFEANVPTLEAGAQQALDRMSHTLKEGRR